MSIIFFVGPHNLLVLEINKRHDRLFYHYHLPNWILYPTRFMPPVMNEVSVSGSRHDEQTRIPSNTTYMLTKWVYPMQRNNRRSYRWPTIRYSEPSVTRFIRRCYYNYKRKYIWTFRSQESCLCSYIIKRWFSSRDSSLGGCGRWSNFNKYFWGFGKS